MIKAGEELLRLQAENQRLKAGIKQAREEIKAIPSDYGSNNLVNGAIEDVLEILDKLESEG